MIVIWNRLEHPGKEWCRLRQTNKRRILEGIVILTYSRKPCHLAYSIECDANWQARKVSINGHIGRRAVSLALRVTAKEHWLLNGKELPSVRGCSDVDLGFSPSTNLLPIRRLNLEVGKSADVTAAWIEFPSLKIKPLKQRYLRLERNIYRYESASGKFKRDLIVNKEGFVTEYPGFWRMESTL